MISKILKFNKVLTFTSGGLFGLFTVYLILSSFFTLIDYSVYIKTPLFIINYILILGALLSSLIGLKYKEDKLGFWLISISLSLVSLMLLGLMINYILPFFGIVKPLASLPLVFSHFILISSLSYIFYKKNSNELINFSITEINVFTILLPVTLAIVSILGVGLLNNTNNNNLILFLYPLIAIFFLYFFLNKKIYSDLVYSSVIFFSALALLFTYSLRGGNILGWDINEEFQVFSRTLENLKWSMSYYKGLDYNACLSITILPTVFRVLTGISAQYIYKFLMQVLFAVLPLSVFSIAKKYLNVRYSFAAAFIFLSQTWFYEQMPALIRQEVAFLIYASILIVLFKNNINNRVRYILISIFSIGVVLSHYTTSYIAIVVFTIFSIVNVFWGKYFGFNIRKASVYMLSFMMIILFVWQALITDTGDAFNKFIRLKDRKGIEKIELTENLKNLDLQEKVANILNSNPSKLNEVYFDVVKQYLVNQDSTKYDNVEASKFIPVPVKDVVYTDSIFSETISFFVLNFGRLFKILVIVFLTLYGIYQFTLIHSKKMSIDSISFIVLNAVFYILILLMSIVPFLQVHYNLSRLFLQGYITLAVFSIIGIKYITDKIKFSNLFFASLIVLMFLYQSGFVGHYFGGVKKITMETIPSDFYTYYIYDSEKASAKWLKNVISDTDKIQSDNIANLRLQSFGDTNAYNTKIFPLSIRKDSFVYLSKINYIDNMAVLQYNNISFTYEYPRSFLDSNKNMIYSNSNSIIYK